MSSAVSDGDLQGTLALGRFPGPALQGRLQGSVAAPARSLLGHRDDAGLGLSRATGFFRCQQVIGSFP